MKIRSAVPENGCLIFMHYRGGLKKKQKKNKKTSVKHIRIAARMRKQGLAFSWTNPLSRRPHRMMTGSPEDTQG